MWISTQGPHPAVTHFAKILGLSPNSVRVIAGDVGGAFGQKILISREETAVAMVAARNLGRPIRWIEDRYENLVAAPHARREFADVSVATDDDGKVLRSGRSLSRSLSGAFGRGVLRTSSRCCPVLPPHTDGRVRSTSVWTNTSSRLAYRGPWMFESVIREVMMDVVARGLHVDPLDLRRRNVLHRSELPYRNATGITYDLITTEETLERAAALAGYEEFRVAVRSTPGPWAALSRTRDQLFVEPTATGARRMSDERRSDRYLGQGPCRCGSGSQGHGIETTVCQIVADEPASTSTTSVW